MSKDMWAGLLTACRPHQWIGKNIVVFFPLLFLSFQEWKEGGIKLVAVFVLLCISASSVYLINDSADRKRDREHPQKCKRPIACRQVPVEVALSAATVFMATALVGGLIIEDYSLLRVLGLYLGVSTAYTFLLKHIPIVDVLSLGGLYAIRLLAGFVAISVYPVGWMWMLAVVWLGAVSLALSKRWAEAYNVTAASRRTLAFYRSRKTTFLFYASAMGSIPAYLFGAAPPYLPGFAVLTSGLMAAYLMHRYWCTVQTLAEDIHPQEVIKQVLCQEISAWTRTVSRAVSLTTTFSLRQ